MGAEPENSVSGLGDAKEFRDKTDEKPDSKAARLDVPGSPKAGSPLAPPSPLTPKSLRKSLKSVSLKDVKKLSSSPSGPSLAAKLGVGAGALPGGGRMFRNLIKKVTIARTEEKDPTTDLIFQMQKVAGAYTHAERVALEKQAVARTFVLEMIRYFLFLGLFLGLTFALRPSWAYESSYFVSQTLARRIHKVKNAEGIFGWLENTVFPVLLPEESYSGRRLTLEEQGYVGGSNRLLGKVRIRQVRQQWNIGCTLREFFKPMIQRCISPEFSDSKEAKEPIMKLQITPISTPNSTHTEYVSEWVPGWEWQSSDQLCGKVENTAAENAMNKTQQLILQKYCASFIVGRTNNLYPSSGFIIDFPPQAYFDELLIWQNLNATATNRSAVPERPSRMKYVQEALAEAKQARWLDKQSIFFTLEFTTYNGGTRILTSSRIMFELFPSGKAWYKLSIKPIMLGLLEHWYDWFLLFMEFILAVCVAFYLYDKILNVVRYFLVNSRDCTQCCKNRIVRHGLQTLVLCQNCQTPFDARHISYCWECQKDLPRNHTCWKGFFQDVWNCLDLWNLTTFMIVIAFRFRLRNDMANVIFDGVDNTFLNMYPLAWQTGIIGYLNSINMLLCFLKTLKYLGKIRSLAILLKTLQYSTLEVVKFLIIFFVFYVGFSLAFFLAFGADIYIFRDWLTAGTTLFSVMLGQFEYAPLQLTNRILAPMLFLTFMGLCTLIMVQLFIAILDGAYVKANNEAKGTIMDFLNSSLKSLIRVWKSKFWCFDKNPVLPTMVDILRKLEEIPELQKYERAEIKRFRKQMTDFPDNILMQYVIHEIRKVPMDENTNAYTWNHYATMKKAARNHIQQELVLKAKKESNVWQPKNLDDGRKMKRGLGGNKLEELMKAKNSEQNSLISERLQLLEAQVFEAEGYLADLHGYLDKFLQAGIRPEDLRLSTRSTIQGISKDLVHLLGYESTAEKAQQRTSKWDTMRSAFMIKSFGPPAGGPPQKKEDPTLEKLESFMTLPGMKRTEPKKEEHDNGLEPESPVSVLSEELSPLSPKDEQGFSRPLILRFKEGPPLPQLSWKPTAPPVLDPLPVQLMPKPMTKEELGMKPLSERKGKLPESLKGFKFGSS